MHHSIVSPVGWGLKRLDILATEPDVIVEFEAGMWTQLEPRHVIGFSGIIDPILPFPRRGSDGSWVGKTFVVTNVRQFAISKWTAEVCAREVVPQRN